MKKAEIPCPEVVLLKKHILVMSFIGKDHVPAPKLKDAMLNSEDLKKAYYQVLHVRTQTGSRLRIQFSFILSLRRRLTASRRLPVQVMQQLYQECNLVHADLSEYNMLWHEGKVQLTCFHLCSPLFVSVMSSVALALVAGVAD